MAPQLVVTRGPTAGTKFPIKGAVCRVGSGTGMTVRIESLEAHAVTLQQRGGETYVFNRGSGSIQVGDTAIPPAASTQWRTGIEVQFSNGIALQLATAGANADPATARGTTVRAVDIRSDTPSSYQSDEQPSPKTNRSRQTALVATFFVLFGGYLLFGAGRSSGGSTETFHALIEDLIVAPHDPRLQRIRRGLQHAYNLETLEYADEAADEYAVLRQLLANRRQTDDLLFGSTRILDLEDRSAEVVRDHLQQLR